MTEFMRARFRSNCCGCNKVIARDSAIRYDRANRKAYHEGCEPELTAAERSEIEDRQLAAYVEAGLGTSNY